MTLSHILSSPKRTLVGFSRTPASHTGDTTETILGTINVPGNLMGANGHLEITSIWRFTGANNTRTTRARVTNVSGAILFQIGNGATALSSRFITDIFNMGATNSQKAVGQNSGGAASTTVDLFSGSIDTTADFVIVLTGALTNGADSVELTAFDAVVISP